MSKVTRLFHWQVRLGVLTAAVTLLSSCASVPAEYRSSRLALQKTTFSGFKYTFDGSDPDRVRGLWLGMYNPSFLDLLSQEPAALAEAKKAEPFVYAGLAITAISTIYAISELAAAASSDNETFAQLNESEEHLTRSMGAVIGGLIFNAILGIPVRNHLLNSVGLFNAGLDGDDSEMSAGIPSNKIRYVVPNSVRANPLTRRFDMGWKLRH